jgi:hypothetical protein
MIGRPDYRTYMASREWAERRAEALMRSRDRLGPRCEVCGRHGLSHKNRPEDRRLTGANGLEVHHLHYRTLGDEDPDDLVVLCTDSLYYDAYHAAYDVWMRRREGPRPTYPDRVGCHERAHDDPAFRREVARMAANRGTHWCAACQQHVDGPCQLTDCYLRFDVRVIPIEGGGRFINYRRRTGS